MTSNARDQTSACLTLTSPKEVSLCPDFPVIAVDQRSTINDQRSTINDQRSTINDQCLRLIICLLLLLSFATVRLTAQSPVICADPECQGSGTAWTNPAYVTYLLAVSISGCTDLCNIEVHYRTRTSCNHCDILIESFRKYAAIGAPICSCTPRQIYKIILEKFLSDPTTYSIPGSCIPTQGNCIDQLRVFMPSCLHSEESVRVDSTIHAIDYYACATSECCYETYTLCNYDNTYVVISGGFYNVPSCFGLNDCFTLCSSGVFSHPTPVLVKGKAGNSTLETASEYTDMRTETATITYDVKRAGVYVLLVTNITSQKTVSVIQTGQEGRPIQYILNTSALPGGMYLYQITNNDRVVAAGTIGIRR